MWSCHYTTGYFGAFLGDISMLNQAEICQKYSVVYPHFFIVYPCGKQQGYMEKNYKMQQNYIIMILFSTSVLLLGSLTLFLTGVVTWCSYKGWFRPHLVGIGLIEIETNKLWTKSFMSWLKDMSCLFSYLWVEFEPLEIASFGYLGGPHTSLNWYRYIVVF